MEGMISYIDEGYERGITKNYNLQIEDYRVEALVSPGSTCMRIQDSIIPEDLTSRILQELKTIDNPNLIGRANEILEAFGQDPISLESRVASLEWDAPDYVKVRHYTNISCARKIDEEGKLGGSNAPRLPDNGKFFVELGKNKPKSPRDAEEAYALKYGKGNAYIEFLVPRDQLQEQQNGITGDTEYFINSTSTDNKIPVLDIASEIRIVNRG